MRRCTDHFSLFRPLLQYSRCTRSLVTALIGCFFVLSLRIFRSVLTSYNSIKAFLRKCKLSGRNGGDDRIFLVFFNSVFLENWLSDMLYIIANNETAPFFNYLNIWIKIIMYWGIVITSNQSYQSTDLPLFFVKLWWPCQQQASKMDRLTED